VSEEKVRVIEVGECCDAKCPSYCYETWTCWLAEGRTCERNGIADWCPLRKGPVLLKLKEE
jgi:hypothetical protein